MKRDASSRNHFSIEVILIAIVLVVSLAPVSRADSNSEAREQFERAVQMRTQLEGYLPKDRALDDYKRTITAYRKVYLISPQSEEATPSLTAQAELYEEMGKQYDPKYFQSAIDTYNFLIKQYPGSRYRGEAELSIARIQQSDLKKPEDAEATYQDYLKKFPHSDKARDARQSLKEIADARKKDPAQDSDTLGPVVQPREAENRTPRVTDIRTWNADNYTRIVVSLDDTVKFDASRITSPDRIYFNIYKARLSPALASKTLAVDNGLLKSVRVAQNQEGVVRLVLDVNGAKDYSAYLLKDPYRLVIDVRATSNAVAKQDAPASAPAAATAVPAKSAPGKAAGNVQETVTVNSKESSPTSSLSPSSKVAAKSFAKSSLPLTKKDFGAIAALQPPPEPKPTRDGTRSLTRTLGLKISRIVIDPGHGGHDTGTIGPHGLMEKDLCLDVALRLGRLIEEKLPGADVIYTRKDDTFIPLEERTAIANQAKADLFISIHANASHDHAARGVETYYLNFATSGDSMDVATRENALSQESLHDLQDLIKKIARNDKIEESKEFADDVQDSLSQRMQLVSRSEKNRGVKKAPFIVLIGANMPSVLSEISFVSNPSDEKLLRKSDQRQRIADGLFHGISTYLDSLNSLSYNKQKPPPDGHADSASGIVAQDGNPK